MAPNVIHHTDFDCGLINFADVSKNKRGGKFVPLSYGPTKQRIFIQTPSNMPVPFGVNEFANDNGDNAYSLNVTFRDMDKDPRMKRFYETMTQLDDAIIATAVEHSSDWFGKPMTKEVVSEFYRHIVKPARDPRWAPTMKIKISTINGTVLPEFYDEQRQKTDMDYVVKGSVVKMILELKFVWFVNKTFGVTWQLVQLGVVSRPQRVVGYSFYDNPEDDAWSTGTPTADDF